MIAKIAKYNDQQLIAAANCFLTNHQQQRLARECHHAMVLTAVLTITALAEADFDSLTAEVGRPHLIETAMMRSLIAPDQVQHVLGQQIDNFLGGYLLVREKVTCDVPTLGNPAHAIFEESVITEEALLQKLQLLFGQGQA